LSENMQRRQDSDSMPSMTLLCLCNTRIAVQEYMYFWVRDVRPIGVCVGG